MRKWSKFTKKISLFFLIRWLSQRLSPFKFVICPFMDCFQGVFKASANCYPLKTLGFYVVFIFNCCPVFQLFFSVSVFFHRHWRFAGQQGKGADYLLFHSTTSTRSQTLRHLSATLHVRWVSRISNRNACVYQTATRWDLPPYRITIWLIGWWCNVCSFTWSIDTKFFVTAIWHGNRWIWIRIDYHPCITSEPTNQVC